MGEDSMKRPLVLFCIPMLALSGCMKAQDSNNPNDEVSTSLTNDLATVEIACRDGIQYFYISQRILTPRMSQSGRPYQCMINDKGQQVPKPVKPFNGTE
jgi:hypothetical protein